MTILTADAVQRGRAPGNPEPAFLWSAVFAGGLCLAVVGWTDIALLWWPLDFGNAEWEFASVGAHVMGMPLGTLGLVLIAAGALGRGWRAATVGVAGASALVTLSLVGLGALYATVVPVALAGTPPELRTVLYKALIKTVVYVVSYLALYSWLAVYLFRAAKSRR
ncbi:MAG: hypothetical protein ABL963_17225 [Longimicrobiales bacterium]